MGSDSFQMESTLGQPSPLMDQQAPPGSDNYSLLPGFWYTIDIVLSEETTVGMGLPEGWSMISLPIEPPDARVSILFPGAEVVYGYDKGAGYVRVKSTDEMKVGNGYWILLKEDHTYTLTGNSIESYTMEVQKGWYMIGGCTYPALPSIENGNIVVIYSYIPGHGYQRLSESEKLEDRKGYWILLEGIIGQTQLRVETENHQ